MSPGIDPITLEVVREALSSIVREMRITLVRTAYSSILYEGEDFSCVLMDRQAQIVAMSKGMDHPLHIVPIAWSMRAVRERFGDDIAPGDIFLHNDPYTGGTHLNDVAMIYPMFAGGELFLFPVILAHWADVGGMSAGSLSGRVTEIYQEGVRIPPIKVYERGRPNQAVLDLIFGNMRGPRDREGDFRAMIGTCRKAAERVEALLARYGQPALQACVEALLDRAEARMRARIRALPPGEYVYEAYLEGGRERLEPLRVRAAVRIAGDTVTVDLAGTSPQTAGPTNVGPAMAPTGAFTILKAFLDPGGDINSGAFRPLTVLAPEGTIVNARRPAPCGGMVEVKYCVESAVMGALSQAIDGKITGDIKGGGNHCYVGGPDPRDGGTFIFYEYPAGGTGAFEGGDGSSAVRAFTESDMTTIQPVEAVEQKYPLRVERTALRVDSGGDGQWRGGLGLEREVRLLARPTASSSAAAARSSSPRRCRARSARFRSAPVTSSSCKARAAAATAIRWSATRPWLPPTWPRAWFRPSAPTACTGSCHQPGASMPRRRRPDGASFAPRGPPSPWALRMTLPSAACGGSRSPRRQRAVSTWPSAMSSSSCPRAALRSAPGSSAWAT
ncbi:MAG: hydantoinase B/oxoprolinase family protein [Candidatus Rokubacteria bacterium]|nr:hydantoinase B/oxoprolinase family protein [Candidatus Rokubacteria bacterium]